MKLIDIKTDLSNMDCHVHSRFSPDAQRAGAGTPQEIADAVRACGLRGFIITDHLDIGHWPGCEPIDFDKYFTTWEKVRADNPDLKIYIGLEIGFETRYAEETARIVRDLPLEYAINSVHYFGEPGRDWFADGRITAYTNYLNAILDSLDAPYTFTTIGHLGFPERYAPYAPNERKMDYETFRPLMDKIIAKAVEKGIRFELNTNAGGEMRLPREAFLRAYKAAGGVRPVLGSDAHVSASVGQYFSEASKFLNEIFNAGC